MKKLSAKGVEIDGRPHSEGGTDLFIDKKPIAEVEDKEVIAEVKDEEVQPQKFVFSEYLGFSNPAKELLLNRGKLEKKSKEKGMSLVDSNMLGLYDKMISSLANKQEEKKQQIEAIKATATNAMKIAQTPEDYEEGLMNPNVNNMTFPFQQGQQNNFTTEGMNEPIQLTDEIGTQIVPPNSNIPTQGTVMENRLMQLGGLTNKETRQQNRAIRQENRLKNSILRQYMPKMVNKKQGIQKNSDTMYDAINTAFGNGMDAYTIDNILNRDLDRDYSGVGSKVRSLTGQEQVDENGMPIYQLGGFPKYQMEGFLPNIPKFKGALSTPMDLGFTDEESKRRLAFENTMLKMKGQANQLYPNNLGARQNWYKNQLPNYGYDSYSPWNTEAQNYLKATGQTFTNPGTANQPGFNSFQNNSTKFIDDFERRLGDTSTSNGRVQNIEPIQGRVEPKLPQLNVGDLGNLETLPVENAEGNSKLGFFEKIKGFADKNKGKLSGLLGNSDIIHGASTLLGKKPKYTDLAVGDYFNPKLINPILNPIIDATSATNRGINQSGLSAQNKIGATISNNLQKAKAIGGERANVERANTEIKNQAQLQNLDVQGRNNAIIQNNALEREKINQDRKAQWQQLFSNVSNRVQSNTRDKNAEEMANKQLDMYKMFYSKNGGFLNKKRKYSSLY
jgi:hypothetical protein